MNSTTDMKSGIVCLDNYFTINECAIYKKRECMLNALQKRKRR